MLKRLFSLVLMLALMLSAGINVRAYGLENDSVVVNDKLNESVFEESEALELSQNNLSRAITDYGMITYSTNFERYDNGCFAQWQNVCVQLAVANTLSYFDYLGRSNLIVGSSLSQAEFTEICTRSNWATTGTDLEDGINALVQYAVHRGYTATSVMYSTSLWSNITSSINSDYPLIVEENVSGEQLRHTTFAVGYKIENGVKYLLVYNGDQTEPMKWLKLSKVIRVYKVWIS